jgi:hypothetical protein
MIHPIVLITLLAAATSNADTTGADIVRAMHDRYAGAWYENLALVQTVKYYDRATGAFDSARVWYESIQLPGRVRSDVAPLDGGNSEVFDNGTWTVIRADTVARSNPGPHPLLLLGFDVYLQPVDHTIAALENFGIDLAKMRRDRWQGRDVYVVGSASSDDTARQFWIDKERLVFVRLVLTNPRTNAVRDIRFDAYERLGGGWIATEVVFMTNGRTDIHERYDYWTIDVEFEPSLFLTASRTRPGWVRN